VIWRGTDMKKSMKVREIMTEDVITVGKNESLEHILYLMEKHDITKIPVVEGEKLLGIVTDGEIAYKLGSFRKRDVSPAHLHASSVMIREFDTISPDTSVYDIIKTVGLPGLTMLPVVENGKLVGVVTKADLLPLVESDAPVKEIMSKKVIHVAPDDRVIHARRLLIDNDIARLPVLDDGKVVGIIAEMDIAKAFAKLKRSTSRGHQKHQVEEMLVMDAMNSPAVTISPETTISDAAKVMLEQNIGGLPVIESKLEGMVTRTDLIKTLK